MPVSSKPVNPYVPRYTLTEHSRGVPRHPSFESPPQPPTQVNVDVEKLNELPTTDNAVASKNNFLYRVGAVLIALILICLFATALAVPFFVTPNSSTNATITTTVTTATVTTVTTTTATTATTTTQTTSTTSTTSTSTTTSTTSTTTSTTRTTSTTSTSTTSTSTSSTTTSTTTTQSPYVCGNMTYLIGYDLPGNDIISTTQGNYTLCCAWCRSYSGCVAYTWGLPTAGSNVNMCFLKNGVPAMVANSLYVSVHF